MNNTKKTEEKQLATSASSIVKLDFAPETVELIKKTIADGATDNELQMFLYQAKRAGLDPLARQIYFVKRGGKVVIQTSIDGFRVVAERNGDYAGQDEPEFIEGANGKPTVAKVRVYKFRGEQRYLAATGVAHWEEYKPQAGQDFMWNKMPHTMLAKVAEALALRKAFPQDLSGIYSDDEIAQANNHHSTEKNTYQKITSEKAKIIADLFVLKGKEQKEVLRFFKVEKLEELNTQQAKALMDRLNSFPDKDQVMEEEVSEAEYVDPEVADQGISEQKEKCDTCGDTGGYHKKGCTKYREGAVEEIGPH